MLRKCNLFFENEKLNSIRELWISGVPYRNSSFYKNEVVKRKTV
jgi:hypothetical protein